MDQGFPPIGTLVYQSLNQNTHFVYLAHTEVRKVVPEFDLPGPALGQRFTTI